MISVATILPGRSRRAGSAGVRLIKRVNRGLLIGCLMLIAVVVVATLIPTVWKLDPNQINASAVLKSPGAQHWLGTDQLGRDLFARVARGCQISLLVAVCSVLIGLVIGIPLGLMASMGGSAVDNVIMRSMDILMSFPAIVLAIVIVAIRGGGVAGIIIAIGIVYVPVLARVTRGSAIAVSRELFVEAARARGASLTRILWRHVLPNSMGQVIVQASVFMGVALLLEAALSFIGLGVRPPTASLGLMLSDGRQFMSSSSWVVASPGLAIVWLVLAFTLIGDGLQDWADPRRRGGDAT